MQSPRTGRSQSGGLRHKKTQSKNSDKSCQEKKHEETRKASTVSSAMRSANEPCTDVFEISMQTDNRAVRLRTAHLQWLIANEVYSNSIDDVQYNLRQHSPSNSARYPIRVSPIKEPTDPEWVRSDFRVHIYHSQRDRTWVKQWIAGTLEARRFHVTTNNEPCEDCDRVIIILSKHLLRAAGLLRKARSAMRGRITCVVKKDPSPELREIEQRCQMHIDLSCVDMHDFSYQYPLMTKLIEGLDLPQSICWTNPVFYLAKCYFSSLFSGPRAK